MARRDPDELRVRALLRELKEAYAEVDRRYAGWSCPSSTDCCRFGVTGREPYVTSIELAAIARAVAARGGWAAIAHRRGAGGRETQRAGRRALPLAAAERPCPLLTEAGRCAIYETRPLGCRTFYCERATPAEAVPPSAVREAVRRIQAIAARHEPDGDRGRPLSRVLPRQAGG